MECSAAWSCTARASDREVIGVGEGARDPRSIKMGWTPSSSIMMFPTLTLDRFTHCILALTYLV